MSSKEEVLVESIRTCVSCRRDATLTCNGCKGAPDGEGGQVEQIWYCGSKCQKIDWTFHKPTCQAAQARRILYRAASTIQLVFYVFQEKVQIKPLSKVKKVGNDLHIDLVITPGSDALKFPQELVENEDDKLALLSDETSEDALGFMHGILETMLQDIYSDIVELKIKPKNKLRHVKKFNLTGKDHSIEWTRADYDQYKHVIFKITLKDGSAYAIDLTGAQYGYHDPRDTIRPWESYNQERIRKVLSKHPFRHSYKTLTEQRLKFGGNIMTLKFESFDNFNVVVEAWVKAYIGLEVMLKLPEESFRRKQGEFIFYLERALPSRSLNENQGPMSQT